MTGRRDRWIAVQALTEGVGPSHRPIETWATLRECWAAKVEMGGRERFVADQVSAPYDTKWELPYSEEWDPELVDVRKARRLVVKGRIHDIVAAQEVGRRRGVEVMTLAGGLLT